MRLLALHHDSARCDALRAREEKAAAEERLRSEGGEWEALRSRVRGVTGIPVGQKVKPSDLVVYLDSLTTENVALQESVKDLAEKAKTLTAEAAERKAEAALAEERYEGARKFASELHAKFEAVLADLDACVKSLKDRTKELESTERELARLRTASPAVRELTAEEAMVRFEDDDLEDFRVDLGVALGDSALETLRGLMGKGYDVMSLLRDNTPYAAFQNLHSSGKPPSPVVTILSPIAEAEQPDGEKD